MPPPLSDSPEDLARRDHAAIARIAAPTPANAAETDLAALYVAASEQWKECLRLVQQPDISACWAMKCRAQANSMMRQAQSALRLLRMQAARQKIEANSAANERAAWTEHCAIGLMAQALSPRPGAAMTAPSTPEPPAEPETVAHPQPEPVAAEECASTYPRNAALMRRLPFLPDNIVYFPPDDEPVPARIVSRPPDGDCIWPISPLPRAGESLPRTWSGVATHSMADEGATPNPEFPSRPAPFIPPSPPASAGGEGVNASLDAKCDRPWRPPNGATLDRRFG